MASQKQVNYVHHLQQQLGRRAEDYGGSWCKQYGISLRERDCGGLINMSSSAVSKVISGLKSELAEQESNGVS